MIIRNINIQNFKSFGNNKQTINFSNKGQLILIEGENGSGKSSFQESFDFTLYGIVRGKEKKRILQSSLPNRLNDYLLTSIDFQNNNKDNIIIERGLKPNKFKIEKNFIDITEEFKNYSQEERDNLIGMNYDIYKSFISMNINDFNNFISLDPETKRKLLNKLFNLEDLDIYFKITKNIIRDNIKNIEKVELDIISNNDIINRYKDNIRNIKEKSNLNKNKEEIKNDILSKKELFKKLSTDIMDNDNDLKKLKMDLYNRSVLFNNKKSILDKINIDIDYNDNKIKILNNGVCPTCDTKFKDYKYFDINFKKLNNKKNELLIDKLNIKKEINEYKEESLNVLNDKKNVEINKNENLIKYNNLKSELNKLKNEYDNLNISYDAINEIKNNISVLEKNNDDLNKLLNDLNDKNDKYQQLNNIFSEEGLRKNIIKSTLSPINNFLDIYLKELKSLYRVKIDEKFNAIVYEREVNEIDPETLSTGESRKINIALAFSYLEIIRKVRECNILFLDEIFANVDYYNIDMLLSLLKKFALKYNINIVIMTQDHNSFNIDNIDRMIKMEKNLFTNIVEESE